MKLVIKNNDYKAILIDNEKNKNKIDLRYFPFEVGKLCSTISMFTTMYDIFKLDGYSNFESCIAGLSLLGGIPKFQVESTIISFGGWNNINWYDIKIHEDARKMSKEIKKMISAKKIFNQTFVYECSDELDILKATIFHFLQTKGKIKKCKNCNRWFMTISRSDAEYCDRITNEKITCKEQNVIKAKKKYKEDEVIKKKESNATYYSNYFPDLLSDFLKKFNKKNKLYRSGKITKNEILQWLEENKASKISKEGFKDGKTSIKSKT